MNVKVYDGDFEIIYSVTANIYENKFILKEIAGFEFIFNFTKDKELDGSGLKIQNNEKTVTITLANFENTFGTGTTNKIKILNLPATDLEVSRDIYFSIYAKSLNEDTKFLQVSATFYLKKVV